MVELPSGTVSMVFSDIEGSTRLLSRLGPAYVDALDGQRRVLRDAWRDHGGAELGTEGDSFFVSFQAAPAAVAATVQAQRQLASFDWPGGERVRVRIGVHTGSPTVHDGGYVGTDVHRAARIAAAAHGGQVVVSATTSELVTGHLPGGVGLRDLGLHQLKDIPRAEHLFQLDIDGLPSTFAALKTLGASSSLPVPATRLVGRDGELAELAQLVTADGVRLVTLTGPGGSGKTRLAIGLAHRLVGEFPAGVYFVAMAEVTTPELMWLTMADVLDLPAAARTPPTFLAHIAQHRALFILDNLEQIPGADQVVAAFLEGAPRVLTIATSRRPLHVPAEYEHPVPPLELPDDHTLAGAQGSGAIELFVQQARRCRPGFALDRDNAADVAAICRRLDGLPLAIELAAARIKLLSPRALLSRLDTVMDIPATSRQVPSRQKTLRDTIAWSYDLLTEPQRSFFRRVGVFAGGADLDALTAVTMGDDGLGADPFDLVWALIDASLANVGEDVDGEPRITMLETVRAFALDRLRASDELAIVGQRHACYYMDVAEKLLPLLREGDVAGRTRLEIEHDNFREALSRVTHANDALAATAEEVEIGLRLCSALGSFWQSQGYLAEARRWLEQVIENAGDSDRPALASCQRRLANTLRFMGDLHRARELATSSVAMSRRLDDSDSLLLSLIFLAAVESEAEDNAAARPMYEEALCLARQSQDKGLLSFALVDYARLESDEQNYQTSLDMSTEALAIEQSRGDPHGVMYCQLCSARTLRLMGRIEQHDELVRGMFPQALVVKDLLFLGFIAEEFAALLTELGDVHRAVRLFGALSALEERLGTCMDPVSEADRSELLAKTRPVLSPEAWELAYQAGRNAAVEDVLAEALAAQQESERVPGH